MGRESLRRHHAGVMEDSFEGVCETAVILTAWAMKVGLLIASRKTYYPRTPKSVYFRMLSIPDVCIQGSLHHIAFLQIQLRCPVKYMTRNPLRLELVTATAQLRRQQVWNDHVSSPSS